MGVGKPSWTVRGALCQGGNGKREAYSLVSLQHRATKFPGTRTKSRLLLGKCPHLGPDTDTQCCPGQQREQSLWGSQKATQTKDRNTGDPLAHHSGNRTHRSGFTPRPLSHSYVVPLE